MFQKVENLFVVVDGGSFFSFRNINSKEKKDKKLLLAVKSCPFKKTPDANIDMFLF